jgi:hypothetical protein
MRPTHIISQDIPNRAEACKVRCTRHDAARHVSASKKEQSEMQAMGLEARNGNCKSVPQCS